jgi:hypothetical protein
MAPHLDTQDPGAQQIARDEQVPLIIDVIRTTRNGSPQNTSAETQQRILSSLAEIGLFSQLSAGAYDVSPSNDKIPMRAAQPGKASSLAHPCIP